MCDSGTPFCISSSIAWLAEFPRKAVRLIVNHQNAILASPENIELPHKDRLIFNSPQLQPINIRYEAMRCIELFTIYVSTSHIFHYYLGHVKSSIVLLHDKSMGPFG